MPLANQPVGECAVDLSPPEIRFDKNVDSGSQGENVEDVNVVVLPFRPHVSEVQELKGKEFTVGRKAYFRLLYLCKAERGGCAGITTDRSPTPV